jgi:heavy metal translocating P-type ATPase
MTPALARAGIAVLGVLAGGVCHLAGAGGAGDVLWQLTIVVTVVPVTWEVVRGMARGDFGVDIIALLAMVAALIGGELLAGAIVAVMLTGGDALEDYAAGRATRDLTALLRRAPQVARRRVGDGWKDIDVDEVEVGDVLLVRVGEIVPADGTLLDGATIDASAVTGEPLPVELAQGESVRSGTVNAGAPFELRATRGARDSSYAALVKLVQEAAHERPPFTRMADRYAMIFLPVTLGLAGAAWALSGDQVRAVAVLVVATPCPLILAAPIALVAGLSRAAGSGIVLKGGGALEQLGAARTVLLDKTGTLTQGRPAVDRIVAFDRINETELLRLAASVDQLSAHVLAEGIVHDAITRGLSLEQPTGAREAPGDGIEAIIDGRRVGVGGESWLLAQGFTGNGGPAPEGLADAPGQALVHVGVDDRVAGVLVMGDRLRPDAADLVAALHLEGVQDVAMVTGDRRDVALAVASKVGLDRVYPEQSPEDKLAVVRAARERPDRRPVVMVGDGVNDAPALALADIGIALAGNSRTVSSEAADAVITVDRIDRVADAVRIGKRTMAIARQSVVAGMSLSIAAMVIAAFGYLPPVAGALLQEGIDVAVILNALRALRG